MTRCAKLRCLYASSGRRGELLVQTRERFGRAIIDPQPEDDAPTRRDEPTCAVNQLLHRRLQSSALGGVAHRRILAQQPSLAHQAQDVHGQRCELAHLVHCVIELAPAECAVTGRRTST